MPRRSSLKKKEKKPRWSICARSRLLDKETILKSVAKTRRAIVLDEGPLIGGLSAEIAAMIQENLFSDLQGPVVRIAAQPIPPPHSPPLVDAMIPDVEQIVDAVMRLVEDGNRARLGFDRGKAKTGLITPVDKVFSAFKVCDGNEVLSISASSHSSPYMPTQASPPGLLSIVLFALAS